MILTIALPVCYKTSGCFIVDICCFITERKLSANGIVSNINLHTKFEVSVFTRCSVIRQVPRFKSKSRNRGCILFNLILKTLSCVWVFLYWMSFAFLLYL